jgi:hypothetical protein
MMNDGSRVHFEMALTPLGLITTTPENSGGLPIGTGEGTVKLVLLKFGEVGRDTQ